MIQIDDVVISFDVFREKFLCNLDACKGECCIEGDAGAPVELEEVEKLEEVLPVIWDELSPGARAVIDKQGAFRAGKTDFYKPISCHLYPIRIGDYGPYKAVNYHRWDVCKAAVLLGKKENLPVYKFLKEPLVRKFGEEWYKELEVAAEELKKRGMI